MDRELKVVHSHLRLCELALEARQRRLENTSSRMSRHYNRLAHTSAMLNLVREIQGVVMQDPDMWDDEPELAPF